MWYGHPDSADREHCTQDGYRGDRSGAIVHRLRAVTLYELAYQLSTRERLDLPFSNDSFDLCLSLLVLMFVPDPEKAVSEMCRVTRPGGIVGACTWAHDGLDLSEVFWEEASKLDREGEARAERALHSNRQGQLSALWKNAGLTQVEEVTLEIQTAFLSFEDYWSPFLTGVGPNGAYLASLSADRRDALRDALRNRLLAKGADGPISLRARALAVRGVVGR